MARSTPVRLFLVLIVLVAMLALLAFILNAAQFGLSLWQQLQTAPLWLKILVGVFSSLMLGFGAWLGWRILRPPRSSAKSTSKPPTAAEIEAHLEAASAAGINTDSAAAELHELARRRKLETVHLALFGEISSGKSSLINALLP
ncbi:MAG: hypothetical protein OEU63_09005, partial [Gammaproteobacteria bacterium]|nr:hypothetical protein [Gammaproteobacteria bacterium]